MAKILVITGDGGESYEALYAVHRFQEESWDAVVAAPSRRRLHLVMHDFEPGWDTYVERQGYGLDADVAFDQVSVDDYAAVLIVGGRAPEYLRNNATVLDIVRAFDRAGKWIFAICHGIQVLVAAGLATGKRVTCYETCPPGSGAVRRHVCCRPGGMRRALRYGPDLAIASGVLPGNLRAACGLCKCRPIVSAGVSPNPLMGVPAAERQRQYPECADRHPGDSIHPQHGAIVEPVTKMIRGDRQYGPPQHGARKNTANQNRR